MDQTSATPISKKTTVPEALGPDSLSWKHAGDNLQLLVAGTTLVLQVSHPIVGAGVGDHSVFKTDPWGRMQRTSEWGMKLLYGGPVKSPQAGQDLRELHRSIKGTDANGKKYFALDPEAYAWVHMTTYYAMVTTQKYFAENPFTREQEKQLLEEWVQQGRVMGIRDQDMPQTVPEFWEYFDNMVANRLEETELSHYLLEVSLNKAKKPPALNNVPDFVWNTFYGGMGGWMRLNTAATLPERLRNMYDLEWNDKLEKRFHRLRRIVKASLPLLPMKMRYAPPYVKAMEARKTNSAKGKNERFDAAA